MDDLSRFSEALARLDAEIADAEERLADLRLKRKGAEAFLAYLMPADGRLAEAVTARGQNPDAPTPHSPAEVVQAYMLELRDGQAATVDDVLRFTTMRDYGLTRDQVRNAIHYLSRKGLVVSVRRGAWRLRDTEGPAATGPSDGVPSLSRGGVPDEDDETASPPAEDQHHPQLGASIERFAS